MSPSSAASDRLSTQIGHAGMRRLGLVNSFCFSISRSSRDDDRFPSEICIPSTGRSTSTSKHLCSVLWVSVALLGLSRDISPGCPHQVLIFGIRPSSAFKICSLLRSFHSSLFSSLSLPSRASPCPAPRFRERQTPVLLFRAINGSPLLMFGHASLHFRSTQSKRRT